MTYYKDLLLERKKSKTRVFLGIGFLILSMVWIISNMYYTKPIELFDWLFFSGFLLNALFHITGGIGYPFEKLIGKAFIEINTDTVNLKYGLFERQQTVVWNDIQCIRYKTNKLIFFKHDGSSFVIPLSKLDYSCVAEIKAVITKLVTEKNIASNL